MALGYGRPNDMVVQVSGSPKLILYGVVLKYCYYSFLVRDTQEDMVGERLKA